MSLTQPEPMGSSAPSAEEIESVMLAARVLIGVTAQSVAAFAAEITLPQLRIPVNAIWGERDQIAYYTIEDRVAALRALCPTVDLRIIPSAGHWAAYEAPDAFNATLSDLLRRRVRTG